MSDPMTPAPTPITEALLQRIDDAAAAVGGTSPAGGWWTERRLSTDGFPLADAAHIANCSPEVVRAMVTRLRRLEAVAEAAKALWGKMSTPADQCAGDLDDYMREAKALHSAVDAALAALESP